ncbi:MAG: M15 family metallopeptidase [Candidatus Saccharimonadales bacterium]
MTKWRKHTRVWLVVIILILIAIAAIIWFSKSTSAPGNEIVKQTVQHEPLKPVEPTFDKTQFSLTDPTSLWVIVNKQHPLSPKDYLPASLVIPNIPLKSNITSNEEYVSAAMAPALEQMVTAAKTQAINLNMQSGYRSYSYQVSLYGRYANTYGASAADTFSAQPGYSEHQTGLAVDLGGTSNPVCNVDQCYASTPEGQWLAANAYLYGFIIRYPDGGDAITGYEYEPWHIRYVGVELSTEMHKQGITTLEQFFGVFGGPDYSTTP